MAKYAIPAEVVFTFDDEPVDIQEMLHDNAESEEVVEGLERLLKAVAAPGFTEAEVVFDIGGGISVVRAARRTANPRKNRTGNPRQKSEVFEMGRFREPLLQSDIARGMIPREMVEEATITSMDGRRVAYLSRSGDKRYTRDTSPRYYLLKSDGTPDRYSYAEKPAAHRRLWIVVIPDDYGNHTEHQTREQALTDLLKHSIPRTGNPGDDGQQSLPLDYGRTGNPALLDQAKRHFGTVRETARSAWGAARGAAAAVSAAPSSKVQHLSEYVILDNGGNTEHPQYTAIYLMPREVQGRAMYHAILLDERPTARLPRYTGSPHSGKVEARSYSELFPTAEVHRMERQGFRDLGVQVSLCAVPPKARKEIKNFLEDTRSIFTGDDRENNPRGGGLVSGYGINTFAMDPDDYAPERQSNPRESIATMLGRPRR